ncbi:MAG: ribosome small subunit-dependent GTPase A [Firmicutes bacterium]|nr:ribosome small subunit-dependent GTPase A [Bacillota bacterium]
MKGKIIKGIGGFYYIKVSNGTVYECKARGIFRKDRIKPMIGDDVEIFVENGKGSIEKIFPRKSILVRPPVANIDILVIVAATANPDPNLFLIDKLLVNSEVNNITPIICINKSDISSAEALRKIYKNSGYTVVVTSVATVEGFDKLMPYLKDKTSAFAGLSGVGKSSILNKITDTVQKTGSVSDKIKRGKHTTRHVELLELECGGYVLDTPGFSSFEVMTVKAGELYKYFPEMNKLGDSCRFKGCSHISEPGCVIKELVSNGKISASRYKSYTELYNQLKNIKDWENK